MAHGEGSGAGPPVRLRGRRLGAGYDGIHAMSDEDELSSLVREFCCFVFDIYSTALPYIHMRHI